MEHLVTTIEQSKALAAAGVKGESVFVWLYHWTTQTEWEWTIATYDEDDKVNKQIPAFLLSELISMCGEKFEALERVAEPLGESVEWCAHDSEAYRSTGYFGSTPIEAVLSLLIAIKA